LARLDPQRHSLVYASAGHPSGYVLNASGQVKAKLPRTGVPLGLRPDTQYAASAELLLEAQDIVVLVTDGIEESIAPDDTLFGIERTLAVIRANRERSAQHIVEAIYQAVRQFSRNSPQIDDVTAIIIKILAVD